MKRTLLALLLCLVPSALFAQPSPYSPGLFGPVALTANTTTAAIPLSAKSNVPTAGSSWSVCNITLTATTISTLTFGVLGSPDGGITYKPVLIWEIATPATQATTMTATAADAYQWNCGAFTHFKYITSATFTATGAQLTLLASPNGQTSKSAPGGAPTTCASANNYVCLNAANNFTGNNTFGSSGAPVSTTFYATDPFTHFFRVTDGNFILAVSPTSILATTAFQIFTNNASVLQLGANNTNVITIEPSGGVSIGTGTPVDPGANNARVQGTLQAGVTATDPGCTTTAHVGKQWFDITTTTTVYKVCLNVAGTLTWVAK